MAKLSLFNLAFIILLGSGCTPNPTRIKEGGHVPEHRVNWPTTFQSQWDPKENFLLLDARPTFELTTSRLQNSQAIRVEDFPLPDLDSAGFKEELATMARRMALKGIEPERKIWIVGKGLNGDASELYFVWLLKMMGVEKVAAVSFDSIQWPVTTLRESLALNAAPWSPEWDENVIVSVKKSNSPYTGFKAPADLLVWASDMDNDRPKRGQLRAFKEVKVEPWERLYGSDLKVQPAVVEGQYKRHRGKEIWISGSGWPQIAAVFLALSSQGYKQVKIVAPSDLSRWL